MLENAFRELRRAWFNKNLKSYCHEREWEDKHSSQLREKQNNQSWEIYNKQTEDIIAGISRPIAPTCGNDFYGHGGKVNTLLGQVGE